METEVREVFHKGSQVVVEWRDSNGDVHRSIFPEDVVVSQNGRVYVEAIEEGQPYGIDWEDYLQTRMGPDAIAAKLRNKGIWTLEDLRQKTPVITGVFNEVSSLNLQSFKESVLRQGKDDE